MTARSIEEAFARRRAAGQAALVPYVTAGYPRRGSTVDVLQALAGAGTDVIKLKIPFSDPLSDGPTIQKSSFQSWWQVRHDWIRTSWGSPALGARMTVPPGGFRLLFP